MTLYHIQLIICSLPLGFSRVTLYLLEPPIPYRLLSSQSMLFSTFFNFTKSKLFTCPPTDVLIIKTTLHNIQNSGLEHVDYKYYDVLLVNLLCLLSVVCCLLSVVVLPQVLDGTTGPNLPLNEGCEL